MLRTLLATANGVKSLPGGEALARILAQRRVSLAAAAGRLAELHQRGDLGKQHGDILHSLVHMHCNRLAGRDWGLEELALSLLLRTRRSLEQAPALR